MKATRWRMPPDRAAGRVCSNSASPKRSNSGSAARRASRRRHALALERERGVAERVAPGQQQVALGHVGARGAALAASVRLRRPARVRLLQAGDQLEQRGLAAARGAHHAKHLARRDLEVEALERASRAPDGRPVAARDAARATLPSLE